MKYVKKCFGIIALLAAAGFFWWTGMNYAGYCHAEHRFLSDEEFIQAAIRHNIRQMNIEESEESIRGFYKINPACCSVDRNSQMASSNLAKLIGRYYVVVELNYPLKNLKYSESESKNLNFYTQYVEVNSCGSRGSMYGERSEYLKTATKI